MDRTEPTVPRVYIEEVPSGVPTITGVSTSVTGFIGRARRGPVNRARIIHGFGEFESAFGTLWEQSALGYAVQQYFLNGGATAVIVRVDGGATPVDAAILGSAVPPKTGLHAFDEVEDLNLLCIPPFDSAGFTGDASSQVLTAALAYVRLRRAILLVDPPSSWNNAADPTSAASGVDSTAFGLARDANAAVYFPRIRCPDPLQQGRLATFAPAGAVAGVIARTDAQRGVWKAPAGTEASLIGVNELAVSLTEMQQGLLNPQGINCLRALPGIGHVVWGARTLRGSDRLADPWKYLPVRRTALFIEESLYRGTQWVVFEPNEEPLWSQIRLSVGSFMHNLFRQGAFQGTTPSEAYFVKCDAETTTQHDMNLGVVNILVGFAPLKPAEFVIIRIAQRAGQVAT
ncbi:MAG TPA: phage tail sheath subtilisin-like domain-containing protein [Longimicrobiales bacterium]|nr:phage tail sheath subtilisin-like domain-containing protein [Longimicrobiales bacterium]